MFIGDEITQVLLVIDGLDQLDKKNRTHTLDLLPITLPIKLMASTLDGDHTQSCRKCKFGLAIE
ncbi:hypothetical protein DDB_G0283221 [Dictyostelium discoideum AX4]|uniref:Uncharacterized protein n=1 Tax=Dictyostelium discoideum TaxID=44689 RepID=Q54RG8_DICDI|nr:hypothetical protein DDB_G0283221 [Dictyostelium discoideum AX4]EAL65849.1 hypothetical protein DDB_G0283221 [Dictyostelium discoideum AX4]|eukprot:XP_639177.1 hypothetical protein DDB_G0283221 [Dictyostelium discoideum AX4]